MDTKNYTVSTYKIIIMIIEIRKDLINNNDKYGNNDNCVLKTCQRFSLIP